MTETRHRSAKRFNKHNRLATAKNRPRQFIQTPQGHTLASDFIEPLANFLAGKLDVQPDLPPKFLRELVRGLDPMNLALAALAPLLGGMFRGWDRDEPDVDQTLKRQIADELYHLLRDTLPKPWGAKEHIQAGHWLLEQAMALDVFGYDEDGFRCLSDGGQSHVAQLREDLIAAAPAYAPRLLPPAPWTGWEKSSDGFRATFVRDWHPETKKAINVAFLNPLFEHAQAVNALASVPLRIDPLMLELVDQFAVDVMGNKDHQRIADRFTVAADVEDARWIDDRVFWCDYNCCFRGRINALGHFNFTRADHVRSLFRFTSGMKLGEGGTYWLEVHCANCEGSTDKDSRAKRIKWVDDNREDIKAIASAPFNTFHKWKDAGKPFAYVAACRELAAAWEDPENFETRLPIGFDGSANGLQHLSLLVRDLETAVMVNLLLDPNDDSPRDVYDRLITKAIELIEDDDCDHAHWWREQFRNLEPPQRRKLLKQPIMTFAYSVTAAGATLQIAKIFKSLRQNEEPPKGAFGYLARKVLHACKEELPGPKGVMDYLCKVAEHCTDQGHFMEWTSPSGFPVSNRYQKPNMIMVNCLRGSVRVAQHKVADGVTDEINRGEAKFWGRPELRSLARCRAPRQRSSMPPWAKALQT